MLRYFRRLEQRSQELGNHRRKYVFAIEKHGRLLIDRLEEAGSFDRVHLRQAASDIGAEMDAVLESGRDEEEKLTLLGCYYALQFLQMNIRSIDLLRLNSSGTRDSSAVYRDFLSRAGEEFLTLTGEYLTRVLDLFLGDCPRPDFVICTVGTRVHQDDVDLGIIDDGGPAREILNNAIGKMAREMMRWASVPDFYLSEHVGSEGYSVSIDEYRRRVDLRILDFVSVTEILGVYPIVGSESLLNEFKKKVNNRYYYRRRKDNLAHEGYLRGLVGEIESLLLWPSEPEKVNPKEDLLRLMSGILGAYRCVHRLDATDHREAMEGLRQKVRALRRPLTSLERNYTFVETFRHLYQQFSAQEEEIDLTDPNEQECLQQVANTMGYEDVGVIRAWEQLMVRYIQHVRFGRETVRSLLPDLQEHIRKTTIFAEWVSPEGASDEEGSRINLAVDFLKRVRFFQGIKYWDDLLEALEDKTNPLLGRFLDDLAALDQARREQIIKYYAYWGYQTFYTLMRLLVTISGRKDPGAKEVFRELNTAFLESVKGTPDEIRRLSTVYVYNPNLVYRYLTLLDDESLQVFHEKIRGDVWDSVVAGRRDSLSQLCDIVEKSSRFFLRAIERVCAAHPDYLLYIGDLEKLDRITQGMLADLIRMPSHKEQKHALGAYYDVQFLRIGLATLQGMPLAQLDAEFTEFADHFLETLFDVCKAEVDDEIGQRILTHDLLALFVAGGHARERAHQDDYDLVVLLNSDSQEMYEYTNKIMTKLNREISRRGIMPQYHLADRFGGYVTRFSELEDYLRNEGRDAYVDMSQLLGARQIVGSGRLEDEFNRKIVADCIFSQKESYIHAVADEIRSRRKFTEHCSEEGGFDIKECPGGLRDLEMGMLLLKVIHEIRDPIGGRFWDVLADHLPAQRWEFVELQKSYQFLNRLRDVYRLSVAPVNVIDSAYFDRPATLLGYRSTEHVSAGQLLARDFEGQCTRVAESLDALVKQVLA